MSKEPSMEEILSSIKRIIAEEGGEAVQAAAPRRGRADAGFKPTIEPGLPAAAEAPAAPAEDYALPPEEVLELTDEIAVEEVMPAPKPTRAAAPAASRASAPADATILSVESEIAARQSLSALSTMLIAPKEGDDNTLDGLVRSLLKPMLKEWLDANLPAMVEDMVAKEIARITGK